MSNAHYHFRASTGLRRQCVLGCGPVHLKMVRMMKDEKLRTLLRKRGYRILELSYSSYSDRKRDELYREIMNGLGR